MAVPGRHSEKKAVDMMRTKMAMTVAATGLALAGTVVAAQPAAAYNCRVVTASNIRFFQYSSGDSLIPPYQINHGYHFRSYGVTNGRFSASTNAGGYWASGWVTADGSYSNLSSVCSD
jgi:hypothetical protein